MRIHRLKPRTELTKTIEILTKNFENMKLKRKTELIITIQILTKFFLRILKSKCKTELIKIIKI